MTADLFDSAEVVPAREEIAEGAMLLRGFARPIQHDLLTAIDGIVAQSPFRHMVDAGWPPDVGGDDQLRQPGLGHRSAPAIAMTPIDPATGRPWPEMPPVFRELAGQAAAQAGFAGFRPEACLVNRYEPGARLSLHQDRDEKNYDAPIVSVSLGLPATFLWGG